MKSINDNKMDVSVEIDLKTAHALEYMAQFHECTVEELVERCLKEELDKLSDSPARFEE